MAEPSIPDRAPAEGALFIADLRRSGLSIVAQCLDALQDDGGVPPAALADLLDQLAHCPPCESLGDHAPENPSAAPKEAARRDLLDALDSQMAADLVDRASLEQAAHMLAMLPADAVDQILLMIDADRAPKLLRLMRDRRQMLSRAGDPACR